MLHPASTAAMLAKTLPPVDGGTAGQATTVRYVIERMCVSPQLVTAANCNRLPTQGRDRGHRQRPLRSIRHQHPITASRSASTARRTRLRSSRQCCAPTERSRTYSPMARTHRVSRYQRCLAGALAALIGLGPLLNPAYAQITALGDQPIGAQVKAKPNIMLTVDDSLVDAEPLPARLGDRLARRPEQLLPRYHRQDERTVRPLRYRHRSDGARSRQGRESGLCLRAVWVAIPRLPEHDSAPNLQWRLVAETHRQQRAWRRMQRAGQCGYHLLRRHRSGPLPGLERYPNPVGPPPAKSPKAGNVYEYWSLWPAPAHNSELNHLYYNPRITYDPPVDSAGVSYPQMNAANTANWTHVVADPWAETLTYVDLTAQVTVGIWCNSDWSVGHEGDSTYCRPTAPAPALRHQRRLPPTATIAIRGRRRASIRMTGCNRPPRSRSRCRK